MYHRKICYVPSRLIEKFYHVENKHIINLRGIVVIQSYVSNEVASPYRIV